MGRTLHLVWFRRDLRLHDHHPVTAACAAAAAADGVVAPVFVLDSSETQHHHGRSHLAKATQIAGLPRIGPQRARFLVECLSGLRSQLEGSGSQLLVRRGAAAAALLGAAVELCAECGAEAVVLHYHFEIGVEEAIQGSRVTSAFRERGHTVHEYMGSTLYHLEDLPVGFVDPAQAPPNMAKRKRKEERRKRMQQQQQQQQQQQDPHDVPVQMHPEPQPQPEPQPEPEPEPEDTETIGGRLRVALRDFPAVMSVFRRTMAHSKIRAPLPPPPTPLPQCPPIPPGELPTVAELCGGAAGLAAIQHLLHGECVDAPSVAD
eukprot:COSAG05_NODE_1176_length_5610_cov_6.982943_2_plen_318_part_00